ncbi:unnamed protein product [Periconia digitata]|uniref:Uncharacterized protein n=1 Tax=Periconia digitata TaxID=1303443 RepID=A0A9W4UNL4_9PLEO|nr:unnamed protein product [Periconia digitata]
MSHAKMANALAVHMNPKKVAPMLERMLSSDTPLMTLRKMTAITVAMMEATVTKRAFRKVRIAMGRVAQREKTLMGMRNMRTKVRHAEDVVDVGGQVDYPVALEHQPSKGTYGERRTRGSSEQFISQYFNWVEPVQYLWWRASCRPNVCAMVLRRAKLGTEAGMMLLTSILMKCQSRMRWLL